jgi:transposase-like protein
VINRHGQVIDVLVCERRHVRAVWALVTRAFNFGPAAVEVTTDQAPVSPV